MSSESEIEKALTRLKADYAESNEISSPFQYFYCPILCKDELAELSGSRCQSVNTRKQ